MLSAIFYHLILVYVEPESQHPVHEGLYMKSSLATIHSLRIIFLSERGCDQQDPEKKYGQQRRSINSQWNGGRRSSATWSTAPRILSNPG
jgi:hypothetical protein